MAVADYIEHEARVGLPCVRVSGLEPEASAVQVRHSTIELHPVMCIRDTISSFA